MVEAFHHGGAEEPDFLARPHEIGDHDRLHAGGGSSTHPGMGILESKAAGGLDNAIATLNQLKAIKESL